MIEKPRDIGVNPQVLCAFKASGGKSEAQILYIGMKAMPVAGIGGSGMSINNAVVRNVETGISIGVFKEKVDFVFSCALVDSDEVF